MQDEVYNLYSIILTCIGFGATFLGIYLVYAQVAASRKSHETDVLIALYQISTSKPLIDDFERVWDLKNGPKSDADRNASMRACLFFEMVGSVTSQKYVRTVLIEEFFGSLVTGCFQALDPWIRVVRETPYNNHFAINFERLARSLESSHRISSPQQKTN